MDGKIMNKSEYLGPYISIQPVTTYEVSFIIRKMSFMERVEMGTLRFATKEAAEQVAEALKTGGYEEVTINEYAAF